MSIFNQDFGKSSDGIPAQPNATAANQSFAPLNFRHREYRGLMDGDYNVLFADGSKATIAARSALEAMEFAAAQGVVHKVVRSTLKRIRLLQSDSMQDRASDMPSQSLIKPGAILVSFDTMTQFIHQQEDQAKAVDSHPAVVEVASVAPIAAFPADEAIAESFVPEQQFTAVEEAEPIVEAQSEPEAAFVEAAQPMAAAEAERALTSDEVDHLLNVPPAE